MKFNKKNPQEIERLSAELSNDPNIDQPLRQMPKQKANSKQIMQTINSEFFGRKDLISAQNINASHACPKY
jgi:hypothetical protein